MFSDNDLLLKRQYALNWSDADLVHWRMFISYRCGCDGEIVDIIEG